MVMLDTNICIYILKNLPPQVKERLKSEQKISISSVVYAELCFGIERSPIAIRAQRKEALLQFVSLLEIVAWDEAAATHYAEIRADLYEKGTPIGNMDMLIAAHARSLGATLVSNNLKEFERVERLKLENWV